jgi:rod shape-determining protein MreB
VQEALRPPLDPILAMLAECLDDLPPQAVSDVMAEGVWAFGGGAQLRGFAGLLEDAFGFPVRVAPRALTCVAEGAAACVEHREVLDAYDAELVAVA